MNRDDFQNSYDELNSRIDKLLNGKGLEYRTSPDVFSNFKSLAEQLDMTKYQVWCVYFMKHITSIENAVKNFPNEPYKYGSTEKLSGRIEDAIAYLSLLNGMVEEDTRN